MGLCGHMAILVSVCVVFVLYIVSYSVNEVHLDFRLKLEELKIFVQNICLYLSNKLIFSSNRKSIFPLGGKRL